VVIAGGLGSFKARPLRLAGLEEGMENLHYKVPDKSRFEGKRVVVLGGGDSALDWALELKNIAAHTTLIHRREKFRAAPASVAALKRFAEDPESRLDWRIATIKDHQSHAGRITGLRMAGPSMAGLHTKGTDEPQTVELDELLVCYGLFPNLGPIAHWGLGADKRQIPVDTATFETQVPGIYAIGDINTYPGKKKLILSGFHEAALAAFAIRERLFPQEKVRLQYTTTSPRLHERLGLKEAV